MWDICFQPLAFCLVVVQTFTKIPSLLQVRLLKRNGAAVVLVGPTRNHPRIERRAEILNLQLPSSSPFPSRQRRFRIPNAFCWSVSRPWTIWSLMMAWRSWNQRSSMDCAIDWEIGWPQRCAASTLRVLMLLTLARRQQLGWSVWKTSGLIREFCLRYRTWVMFCYFHSNPNPHSAFTWTQNLCDNKWFFSISSYYTAHQSCRIWWLPCTIPKLQGMNFLPRSVVALVRTLLPQGSCLIWRCSVKLLGVVATGMCGVRFLRAFSGEGCNS